MLNDVQKQRLEDCSDQHRGLLKRVYSGNRSMRDAIDAFCVQCVGYIVEDVRNCTAIGCPLWQLRPYQVAAPDKPKRERSEAQKAASQKRGEELRNLSKLSSRTTQEST
jgi:hypothetical protein